MAEKYKADQYSIYEHGREYRVLAFPEYAGERDSDYYAQYVGIGWIWQDTILPES